MASGGVELHAEPASFSPDGKYLVTASADGSVLVWEVERVIREHSSRKVNLSAAELRQNWQDLGSTNKAIAVAAHDRLVEAQLQALPLLRKMLKPISDDGTDRWIAALDSATFAQRQEATRELERREFAAQPALRQALEGNVSLEVLRRVEAVLKKLETPMTEPEVLRAWRSVGLLEQIGTAEAKCIIEKLSTGTAHARLTQRARAALQRWSVWPPFVP